MELFEQLKSGRTPLSVVGLGYVSMPLAVAFAPMPNDEKIIIDVKSILPKDELLAAGYRYWRL